MFVAGLMQVRNARHHRLLLVGFAILVLIVCVGAQPLRAFAQTQQLAPGPNSLSIPTQQRPEAVPALKVPLPQPETALEVPSLKLRGQPGYQQVTITVTDPSGKYVTDLKEGDFRVFENGEQRPIGFFRVDRSAPVSVGIIVDCSMSMTTKLTQARRAITRMVADLDPRDEIFLAAFSATAGMVQPFTFDHQRIVDRLKFLHPFTQTALYDAVSMGLYQMRRARRDKRALLVVTDGMDNRSTTTRAEVIASARALKVLIYTIGIGDEAAKRGDQFLGGIFSPDEDEVDMPTLKVLSEETGAKAFNLRRVGDGTQLSEDCEAISNELTRQYTVAYLSPDPGRPGYRTLRVDIPKRPDLSVRVRKGVSIFPH
jgi:Ca-activated chloride channel family protein